MFQRQGLQAKSVKEKRGGEEFDFDVLVRWDPYLFLLECKSRSLSGPSKVASVNFLREVNTQIGQVHRLAKGLNDYPDILERHMGQGASALTLVPCVLNALPFAAGEMDRVYFTDASGIGRLFESETFNQRIVRGDTTITVPGPRLWAGSTIAPGDLMRQIDDSPQLKMALDELRVRDCFALVAPGVLATTKRPVREPKGSTERAAILDAGSTPGIGPDP